MADTTTAVTVIQPTTVSYTLDNFPINRFNRVIQTATVMAPSDLYRPQFETVEMEPADGDGKSPDHYSSRDIPGGHRALTARGLSKLAGAAHVSFFDEHRIDDGADPNIMGVACQAAMKLPGGDWVTAPGSQLLDLRTWFGASTSEAEKAKFRKQFYAHVRTRARNTAIRGLLSVRQSYPERDLAKPFVVVTWSWNMDHPEVRERALAAAFPAVTAAFGPAAAMPQLGGGQAMRALPEAPEDDEPTQAPRALTPGRAPRADADSGTQASGAPGASEAGTPPEPDWITGGAAAAASSRPSLRDIVAERLADEGQPVGPMTAEQAPKLGQIFEPFAGDRTPIIRRGVRALLGVPAETLTAAQARAIGMAHDELGAKAFLAEWAELAS
jgi:hypothetical protein